MPIERLPIVGVFGSGKAARFRPGSPEHQLAYDLGACIARLDCHLLTGGGQGAMAAVSQGFADVPLVERKGRVIGILPGEASLDNGTYSRRAPYPNGHVEIPIYTHLPQSGENGLTPLSRNHIDVLTADAIVVLDGDQGTLSEAHLAMRYKKPVVAYATDVGTRAGLAPSANANTLPQVESFLATALGTVQPLPASFKLQSMALPAGLAPPGF